MREHEGFSYVVFDHRGKSTIIKVRLFGSCMFCQKKREIYRLPSSSLGVCAPCYRDRLEKMGHAVPLGLL